jgi:hypothetical protein
MVIGGTPPQRSEDNLILFPVHPSLIMQVWPLAHNGCRKVSPWKLIGMLSAWNTNNIDAMYLFQPCRKSTRLSLDWSLVILSHVIKLGSTTWLFFVFVFSTLLFGVERRQFNLF